LTAEVADKQDRHTSVILGALEVEMYLQIVETPVDHSISIEEVEEVHEPKNRLEDDC
jgi:hypothetical protein